MAYSTSNPPSLVTQNVGNTAPAVWTYQTTDAIATVTGAGYFTNGGALGMKVGDLVDVYVSSGTVAVSSCRVTTVSSTYPYAVTVGTATTIGA